MTIIVVVVAILAVAGLLVIAVIGYVKSEGRKKRALMAMDSDLIASRVDTCANCGQKRIIVSQDDKMCAACYSALRTKKLG